MAKIELRDNGTLVYDGVAIARFDETEGRLVVNLGWCDAAGMKITVLGDPMVDRRRVVLMRPIDMKRLDGGDQLTIDDVGDNGAKEKVGGEAST